MNFTQEKIVVTVDNTTANAVTYPLMAGSQTQTLVGNILRNYIWDLTTIAYPLRGVIIVYNDMQTSTVNITLASGVVNIPDITTLLSVLNGLSGSPFVFTYNPGPQTMTTTGGIDHYELLNLQVLKPTADLFKFTILTTVTGGANFEIVLNGITVVSLPNPQNILSWNLSGVLESDVIVITGQYPAGELSNGVFTVLLGTDILYTQVLTPGQAFSYTVPYAAENGSYEVYFGL